MASLMGQLPSWALCWARNYTEPCKAHPALSYWAMLLLPLLPPRVSRANCRKEPGMLGPPLSCRLLKSKPGPPRAALLRGEGGKGDMGRAGIETSGI